MTEIKVPTLGESVTEATVATWFKSPGDTVAIDEMLCELETDKVTVEVPSTVSGTLSEIIAKEGDTVGLDAILGIVSEGEFVKTKTEKSVKNLLEVFNEIQKKFEDVEICFFSTGTWNPKKEKDIDVEQMEEVFKAVSYTHLTLPTIYSV